MRPVRVSDAGAVQHRRSEHAYRQSWTSLCYGQQFSAAHKQIHQCTGDEQPMRVLLQSAVANLHESELQLHHLKDVLPISSNLEW